MAHGCGILAINNSVSQSKTGPRARGSAICRLPQEMLEGEGANKMAHSALPSPLRPSLYFMYKMVVNAIIFLEKCKFLVTKHFKYVAKTKVRAININA